MSFLEGLNNLLKFIIREVKNKIWWDVIDHEAIIDEIGVLTGGGYY